MSAKTAATAKTSPSTFSQSGAWTGVVSVLAKTKLQQQSGESDGRDDHQGERAEERGTAGVDHHQSEREQEQSGGNDGPAAWLGRGGRVGSGVGQGVPSQVIQGGAQVFKWAGDRLLLLQFALRQLLCCLQCICGFHLHIRLHARSFPVGL